MKIEKQDIIMRYKENGRVKKAVFSTYALLGKWLTENFENKTIISIVNMKKY